MITSCFIGHILWRYHCFRPQNCPHYCGEKDCDCSVYAGFVINVLDLARSEELGKTRFMTNINALGLKFFGDEGVFS